jgi:hypothetical protein
MQKYKTLVGKPGGKIPLGRHSYWEDNIKMNIKDRMGNAFC